MERREIYSILERDYFGPNAIEADELRLIEPYLREADLFVDLGASLGQYTKFANEKMRPGASIISVEADLVRYERLVEVSAGWAKASNRQIEPVHAAISDKAGRVSFSVTDSNVRGSLTPIAGRGDAWRTVEVQSTTLDSLLGSEKRKSILIKMDVEGSEYLALAGARELLASDNAVGFFIELHPWGNGGKYADDCIKLLRQAGFGAVKLAGHTYFARGLSQKRMGAMARREYAKRMLRQVPGLLKLRQAIRPYL